MSLVSYGGATNSLRCRQVENMKGDKNVRLGILGTGVVGKTIAARLAGLGHEVMVGTRDPEEARSSSETDGYGNSHFSAWR